MSKCIHCGEKANLFTGLVLKGGEEICKKCKKELEGLGLHDCENWHAGNYDVQTIEDIFKAPEVWVKKVQDDYQKEVQLKEQQKLCAVCGNPVGKFFTYITADQYAVCGGCSCRCRTIDLEEYMREPAEYMHSHEAEYFRKNLSHVEEPIKGMVVNFSTGRLWNENPVPNTEKDVVSFDSIVKFESDIQTYEVTVGKKGHPIVRAMVGSVFGPVGAVVGAMTAKNTKHQESRTGKRYINIYYKGELTNGNVEKMTFYTESDSEIVAAEDCLKRAFGCDDTGKIEAAAQESKNSQLQNDGYGELIELKKMLDMEIITPEEFELKKRNILGI